jgi:hypothetical protein
MRHFNFLIAACLAAAAQLPAHAADSTEPGGPSESCIAAALAAHPGIVTGWQRAGGGLQPLHVITVLDKEGKMAETTCDPATLTLTEFKSKIGRYRFEMYERATLAEEKARVTAPAPFVGPVSFYSMQLSIGFAGKPVYTYKLSLPGGYMATVDIDAVQGRMNKAVIE